MNNYVPELGQAMFGNPWSGMACPEFVEAGLRHLKHEIKRVEYNNGRQTEDDGGTEDYDTPVFSIRSYWWGDCECAENEPCKCRAGEPNFKCGDFEVRWYKYLGRGMSMNRSIDANEFFALLDKCMIAVRERDVKFT